MIYIIVIVILSYEKVNDKKNIICSDNHNFFNNWIC